MRKKTQEYREFTVANDGTVTWTPDTPIQGEIGYRFYANGTFSAGTVNVSFEYGGIADELDSIEDIDCTATQLLSTVTDIPAVVSKVVFTGSSMAGGTDWGIYVCGVTES